MADKPLELQEMRHDLRVLKKAVFGDPDDLRENPGIVHELSSMDQRMNALNETLTGIRTDLRKAVWIIIAGVITHIVFGNIKLPWNN